MNSQLARVQAGVVLLFLFACGLFAADGPTPAGAPKPGEPVRLGETAPAATGLVSKAELDANLDSKLGPVITQLGQIQKKIDALTSAQANAVSPATFSALQSQVNVLQKRLSDLEGAVGDIARASGALPDGRLSYVLDLAKSKEDATFQTDMNHVVRRSLLQPGTFPQQGTLRINNEMYTDQDILVNGVRYSVPAHSSRDFIVPAGTATTQLPVVESPKNWMIGPPNYLQQVNITPRFFTPPFVEPIRVYPPLLTVY